MLALRGQKSHETHVAPVHFPFDFLPLTMSQYKPEGIDVVKVASHEPPALLRATWPTEALHETYYMSASHASYVIETYHGHTRVGYCLMS